MTTKSRAQLTKAKSQPAFSPPVYRRILSRGRAVFLYILELLRRGLRRLTQLVWRRWPGFGWGQIMWLRSFFHWRVIKAHRADLSTVLAQHPSAGKMIVFPPGLDWNVQLFQRPQQLAMALARQGALVFYMQPKPKFDQPPFVKLSDGLYLCNTFTMSFDMLTRPVVYLLTWNSDYRYQFRNPCLLYDYVDDIDVFYGDRVLIAEGHQALLRDADLIAATAVRLQEGILGQRPDALLCPNGVEYERFYAACHREETDPPVDLQPILTAGKPIIGYYGALARWFNYALVDRLAELRPGYHFVLIGPDYDGTLRKEALFQRQNVHWLDVKPYVELPGYLAFFDVAIIPFVVSEITHATSPLKLFEYMAGGKPVVITPMEESMRYPGVLVGGDAQEFAARLDEALALRRDTGYLATIDAVARQNTWDARARQILDALR